MNRFAKLISLCVVSMLGVAAVGDAVAAPFGRGGGRAPVRPQPRDDNEGNEDSEAPRGPNGRPGKGPQRGGPQRGGPRGRGKMVFRRPPSAPAVAYIGHVVHTLASANRKGGDDKMKQALTDVCIAERLLHISVEEAPPAAPPAGTPDAAPGAAPEGAPAAEAPAPEKAKPAPNRGGRHALPRRTGHKRPHGMAVCRKVKDDDAKAVYKSVSEGVTLKTGKRGVAVAYAQRACELGKSLGAKTRCDLPKNISPDVLADVKALKDKLSAGEKQVAPVEATPAELKTAATEATTASKEVEKTDAKEATEDKAAETAAPAATDAPATTETSAATDAPATTETKTEEKTETKTEEKTETKTEEKTETKTEEKAAEE